MPRIRSTAWSEEAIGKARKEHKLIFLSIGYSTCYWCHVAERTIYSKPAIALPELRHRPHSLNQARGSMTMHEVHPFS
jgi:hypothetical protein